MTPLERHLINITPPDVRASMIRSMYWLGKHNWLNVRPAEPSETDFLGSTGNKWMMEVDLPNINNESHEIKSYVRALTPDSVSSLMDVKQHYTLTRAIQNGVRLIKPTYQTCRAIEHIELNIHLTDYQQPFPGVFIELPDQYVKELHAEAGATVPKDICIYYDPESSPMIWITSTARYGEDVYLRATSMEIEADETIEEAFEKFQCHKLKPNSNDIEVLPREPLQQMIERLALTCCMLAIANGHSETTDDATAAKSKVIHKRLRRAQTADERERLHLELRNLPKVISINQEIDIVDRRRAEPGEYSGVGKMKKPHWRKGHIRVLKAGVAGRTEKRIIFIKPFPIHRELMAGGPEGLSSTYNL